MSTAIKVENLSKQYRLGQIGTGTISHDLNRWWHKVRGNDDPYLKIGEVNDRTIKGESEYVWALKDINFNVKQGEVLGIIGKNGAGKSTLLKILSRTTAPTTGSVKIKGRIASLLEVGTGFHPELSGRENVFLNGAILGMTQKEIKTKFDEIVDFSGVERYIDTPVKRYSSGMYVRLAFAVAAHLESEVLIVDEVLAVGDAEFQKKCLGKMGEVSKGQGRTVLFVSHNMYAIKSICNECLIMLNGYNNFQGPVDAAIDQYLKIFRNTELSGRFQLDSTAQSKEAVYLTQATLLNSSNEAKVDFECDDQIIIQLTFVLKRLIKGLKGYIAIRNSNEDNYIESDSFDFLPSVLEDLPVGEHTFNVIVPNRVLPVGKHFVYLDFSSNMDFEKTNFGPAQEILSFNLIDSKAMRGSVRAAYTSATLKWENIK